MSDLNNCFSCIHYGDDEGICANFSGADHYPEPIENPEVEKSCFVLEPWIAVERLSKAEDKIITLLQIIELQAKAIEFYAQGCFDFDHSMVGDCYVKGKLARTTLAQVEKMKESMNENN